jgi:raffinose/stachyose/melibiose transport system substrate-binding protein
MFLIPTTQWGLFQSLSPTFKYSVFPYPAEKPADQRLTVQPTPTFWVNKTNGDARLQATLKLVDFIARPKQAETYGRATGALVPAEALRTGVLPSYLTALKPLTPLFKRPLVTTFSAIWPNANIANAAVNGVTGLFTGQKTIDQILTDMDNAWQ